MTRATHASRRGSTYVLVLGTATLVLLIGVTAIARARINLRIGTRPSSSGCALTTRW